MARSPQRQGIETRVGADGRERHRAEVREPGTRRKVRGPWRDALAEARADRVKLLGARDEGRLSRSTAPTVREAGEAWLADAEEGRAWTRTGAAYKPSTVRSYRDSFRLFLYPALGDRPVDRLRRSDVQAVVDAVSASHSGQTARNAATALRALYRYLLGRYDDLADPTDALQLPSPAPARERIATLAEVDALLAALPEADRPLLATAAFAGLRRGELQALRVEDVDLARRVIHVRRNHDRLEGDILPKSDAGVRDVPIFARLLPHLRAQEAARGPANGPTAYVFPGAGRWGTRPGVLSADAYLKRTRKAWLAVDPPLEPLGLHEARHTFASLVLAAVGADWKRLSVWLGHASVAITLDRYAKLLPDSDAEVVERIDAFLGEVAPETAPTRA